VEENAMTLNGQLFPLSEAAMTVADLLSAAGFEADRVAVMRNGDIVPRRDLSRVVVAEDDVLEVISFVGGG
jgi:thiamine biosynthesis protein ThiS